MLIMTTFYVEKMKSVGLAFNFFFVFVVLSKTVPNVNIFFFVVFVWGGGGSINYLFSGNPDSHTYLKETNIKGVFDNNLGI